MKVSNQIEEIVSHCTTEFSLINQLNNLVPLARLQEEAVELLGEILEWKQVKQIAGVGRQTTVRKAMISLTKIEESENE